MKTNPQTESQRKYVKPQRIQKIIAGLEAMYPDATCALKFKNPFQLLVATILSAQCTDERVNKVTPKLFAKFPTPQAFSAIPQAVLEKEIHSTGFFRNKSKNIIGAARMLVSDHKGKISRSMTMEDMLALPGVARKTANVVFGNAFGIPTGVVVDTHVFRISRRLKFSTQKTPDKVEKDLMKIIPQERWIDFSHQVIHHGRQLCSARRPLCTDCPLDALCDAPDKTI